MTGEPTGEHKVLRSIEVNQKVHTDKLEASQTGEEQGTSREAKVSSEVQPGFRYSWMDAVVELAAL